MLVFCVLQVQHQFQKNVCPCSALHNPLLLELVNRKGTEIQKTRNLCPCSASKLLFLVIALSSLLSLQLSSFTLPLFLLPTVLFLGHLPCVLACASTPLTSVLPYFHIIFHLLLLLPSSPYLSTIYFHHHHHPHHPPCIFPPLA